ncbi:hypothetical protein MTX20_08705 [Bradyrhizobium sp. ISRA435]|nr:hypothetical protein MTX20_08705 [Bradyrhizobium sp. ISRA435]
MHQNYALDIVSLRFGSIKDEAIEYLPARGACDRGWVVIEAGRAGGVGTGSRTASATRAVEIPSTSCMPGRRRLAIRRRLCYGRATPADSGLAVP